MTQYKTVYFDVYFKKTEVTLGPPLGLHSHKEGHDTENQHRPWPKLTAMVIPWSIGLLRVCGDGYIYLA